MALSRHSCCYYSEKNIILKIPNHFKIFEKKNVWNVLKHYTFEQWAFIVKRYFRSNLYWTTLQLYKKRFHDTPNIRTVKWIIEWFQMEYTLANTPRLGRPQSLSDDDRTKIREYADVNPDMFAHVAQELGYKCETVHTMLKKEGSIDPLCCTNWSWKITLHITIIAADFLKNLATMSKQWRLQFFQTKCGLICWDMLIRKITVSGRQIIHTFLKKLHYTQLKSMSGAQFLYIESLIQFFFPIKS